MLDWTWGQSGSGDFLVETEERTGETETRKSLNQDTCMDQLVFRDSRISTESNKPILVCSAAQQSASRSLASVYPDEHGRPPLIPTREISSIRYSDERERAVLVPSAKARPSSTSSKHGL